jgi:DNA polymerase-3 subunit delta'
MLNKHLPPAQLWLGDHEYLTERVTTYLQQQLCTTGCGVCHSCMQIRQQQHHAVVWICPEKGYTLAHIQEIHDRIIFALDNDERFFFVLQKADHLSTQCANSLLKSIEEPPAGYHFILCAQQLEQLLPTIKSRCIINSFLNEASATHHTLTERFFFAAHMPDPQEFTQTLQRTPLSEQQAMLVVDELLTHWMKTYSTAVRKQQAQKAATALHKVELLKELYTTPPMPGSSSLFLKHLFLRYYIDQG